MICLNEKYISIDANRISMDENNVGESEVKETYAETKSSSTSKTKIIASVVIIFIIGIAIGKITTPTAAITEQAKDHANSLTMDETANMSVEYINKNLLRQGKAKAISIDDLGHDIYSLKIDI